MKCVKLLSLTIILSILFAGCANTKSKVVNIIDRMPAENSQIMDEYAAELVELNPKATILLAKMLLPPTDPNDNAARYGLSALAHHVARDGAEAERAVYAAALIDAFSIVPEKQNKAFLISQLQLVGKEEAVALLAEFLNDDVLCDYAARALLTIGGESVEPEFLAAMDSATGANKATIIKALGQLQSKAAVKKISPYTESCDLDVRETALYALANIGDPSSQRILDKATQTEDAYKRAKYTSLYLLFARQLAETGNPDLCVKICNSIVQRPGTTENIRAAARNTLHSTVDQGQIATQDPVGSIRPLNTAQKTAILTEQEKADGFVPLFNGTDLTGWVGVTDSYGVKDGVLFCRKNTGRNIYTDKEYDNFVLRFEFKLEAGTNNGLGIRTPLEGDAAYYGMELQILDNTAEKYSNLHDWQYHGSIYGVVPAAKTKRYSAFRPVGKWNYEEVIADGNHISVKVNGETIVDADIKEATENGTKVLSDKPHPGLFNKTGHIGFLGHGDYVEFRNIRLLPLK